MSTNNNIVTEDDSIEYIDNVIDSSVKSLLKSEVKSNNNADDIINIENNIVNGFIKEIDSIDTIVEDYGRYSNLSIFKMLFFREQYVFLMKNKFRLLEPALLIIENAYGYDSNIALFFPNNLVHGNNYFTIECKIEKVKPQDYNKIFTVSSDKLQSFNKKLYVTDIETATVNNKYFILYDKSVNKKIVSDIKVRIDIVRLKKLLTSISAKVLNVVILKGKNTYDENEC